MPNLPNKTDWDVPDLVDWLQEQIDAPRWIVKTFVPHEGVVLISGPPKLGNKTYTAFCLALVIATGRSMYGFQSASEPLNTLIVVEEGARAMMKDRWEAVFKGAGVKPEDVKGRIKFSFQNLVKLNDDNWEAKILRKVQDDDIKVVILDPLANMILGDENKTADMARVFDTVGAIVAAGATPIVLLHLNKVHGIETQADIDSQLRGSGVTAGRYDVHIGARRYSGKEKAIRWIVRAKDQEEKYFLARFEFVNNEEEDSTRSVNLQVRVDDRDDDDIDVDLYLKYLKPGKVYTKTGLQVEWGVTKPQAAKMREQMVEEGALEKVGGSYRINQIEIKEAK